MSKNTDVAENTYKLMADFEDRQAQENRFLRNMNEYMGSKPKPPQFPAQAYGQKPTYNPNRLCPIIK
jgi:hypothetical protein